MGHASEDEERDTLDWLAEAIANSRMRKFMDHDRSKKEQRPNQTDKPVFRGWIAWMKRGEIALGESPQDQDEDNNPRKVDGDLNASDAEQIEFTSNLGCHTLPASRSVR